MNTPRLIATALTLAFVGVLGGCSSTPSWDPTDLMDFLDTKKPTPGVRKPVFPEGVPGMTQGVPKELVKGSPEANAAEANLAAGGQPQPQAEAPPPAPPPPAAKRTRTTSRAKPAPKPVEIAPDDVNVEEPTPARRQTSRPRAVQEPVEQQQSPSPFPAPLPR